MKHNKLLIISAVLLLVFLTMGAAKQSNDLKRMGIFVSNFTELGLYDFDVYDIEDEDGRLSHFGDQVNMGELIRFGIGHNIINNSKSTLKRCPDKNCEYGPSIMSAQNVASSVKKYLDMNIKNQSVLGDLPEVYYDGKSYHFDPSNWDSETTYYADVQNVSRKGKVITMTGELYDVDNKTYRPAYFTATAKPHKWNNKDTWAILSLTVDWK